MVTSIERITNILWLSLNKRFIKKDSPISSMSVTAHAQVFISRRLDKKLMSFYNELDKEQEIGRFDSDEIRGLMHSVYSSSCTPEEITDGTIDSVANLLSIQSIAEYRDMVKREHEERGKLLEGIAELKHSVGESQKEIEKLNKENSDLRSENASLSNKSQNDAQIIEKQALELEQLKREQKRITEAEIAKKKRWEKIKRTIGWIAIVLFCISAIYIFINLFLEHYNDPEFSWKDYVWTLINGIAQSLIATAIGGWEIYTKSKEKN